MKKIKDIRKQEIMEKFHETVNQYGFTGATLNKIAGSLGVAPSLLLHYFKSKEGMIVAFTDYIIQKYEAYFLRQLPPLKNPKKRFENLLDKLLLEYGDSNYLVSDRGFYECYALSLTHPKIKEKFRQFYSRFRGALIKELNSLTEAGVIKPANARLVSGFLIVLLEGKDFYSNLFENEASYKQLRKYLKDVVHKILVE